MCIYELLQQQIFLVEYWVDGGGCFKFWRFFGGGGGGGWALNTSCIEYVINLSLRLFTFFHLSFNFTSLDTL